MNAKKLFGLLVCVAVSAVAINAYANKNADWFGASAEGTTLKLDSATTNGASITVSDSKITIDNDYDTLLAVAPEEKSPALNDGLVTITSTAVLTPCAVVDLPTVFGGGAPQVGFAVATVNNSEYYYYTYGSGSTPAWGNTGAKVDNIEEETTFTIVLDYRTNKATFKVGNKVVTNDVAFAGTSLTDVAAFGSGSISSIGVDYEEAVCAVVADGKTTKYGSVYDALKAGGTSGASSTINYIDSSGAAQGTTAVNGLDAATCLSLGLDATRADAVARFIPADSDPDTGTIALKLATEVDTSVNVTYTIKGSGSDSDTQTTNTGIVTIPTTTGVYTITPTSVSTLAN